jgi:exodeoxyribonuclease V alpha subunit
MLDLEIAPVDLAFAETLLKGEEFKEEHASFLAYLLASARSGSLFIDLEEMPGKVSEGAKTLPKNLLSNGNALAPVIQEGTKFYLQRLYHAKQICFREWNRLCSAPPLHVVDPRLFQIPEGLTDEQKKAVELGCRSPVFILTGGPGTGKTFTAGRLLKTFLNGAASGSPIQIAIAAPTGKAALTLQTALSKTVDTPLQAKTLHALLSIKGYQEEGAPVLPYDILLVDESSMIDVELMARLLCSIKSGAKLILLGDPYQLPPVEGAPIFPFLAESHLAKVELKQCLRMESSDLLETAQAILKGGQFSTNSSVKLLDNGEDLKEVLKSHLVCFPQSFPTGTGPAEMLSAFQRFKILTPLRKGKAGSEEINRFLFQALKKEGLNAIPIMITANDYRFELYNGEVGVLMTRQKSLPFCFTQEDVVYFSSIRKLPALLLPDYELAYAMTVHKSQGSEFDEVLLLLPSMSRACSQALLYTAFTRAKKRITVWREGEILARFP